MRSAIAAIASLIVFATVALGITGSEADAQSPNNVGRIIARTLSDSAKIEFGWQVENGERILPRSRFLLPEAPANRWLQSSDIVVDGVNIGRINARKHITAEGGTRIEFAFTPPNGERILPKARFLPSVTSPDEWLTSTLINWVEELGIDDIPANFGIERAAHIHALFALRNELPRLEHSVGNNNILVQRIDGEFSPNINVDVPITEFFSLFRADGAASLGVIGYYHQYGITSFKDIEGAYRRAYNRALEIYQNHVIQSIDALRYKAREIGPEFHQKLIGLSPGWWHDYADRWTCIANVEPKASQPLDTKYLTATSGTQYRITIEGLNGIDIQRATAYINRAGEATRLLSRSSETVRGNIVFTGKVLDNLLDSDDDRWTWHYIELALENPATLKATLNIYDSNGDRIAVPEISWNFECPRERRN